MNSGGAFNCERYYKYVRTAVLLRVLGVWERAHTFVCEEISHWEGTMARDHPMYTEENLEVAWERAADGELIRMVQSSGRRQKRSQTLARADGLHTGRMAASHYPVFTLQEIARRS